MTVLIDPLKLITKFAAPLIKAVGREYRLRDADEKSIAFAGVDAEISAALDVLSRNADKPGKALLDHIKGKIQHDLRISTNIRSRNGLPPRRSRVWLRRRFAH